MNAEQTAAQVVVGNDRPFLRMTGVVPPNMPVTDPAPRPEPAKPPLGDPPETPGVPQPIEPPPNDQPPLPEQV